MRIILMGAPGVGKGTEAALLTKHYQIPHISTGQIFRDEIKAGTKLGAELASFLNQGKLVPDEVTNAVVRSRLNKSDVENGFLFDGYPRTIEQAKALDQILLEKQWKLNAIVNIEAPKEVIIERLAGRYTCSVCGAIYHIKNRPPKVAGICDLDGGKLIQREDDKVETVEARLNVYQKQTAPLIDYYQNKDAFVHVDGSIAAEVTHQAIMKVLGEVN